MWNINVSGNGEHVSKMIRELGDAEKHGLRAEEQHSIESAIRSAITYLNDYPKNQVHANISGREVSGGESHRYTAQFQVHEIAEEDGA